jgi:phage repressor protein C with HTH and peptisase S24 domain
MSQNIVSQRLTEIIDHFADGNEKRFADSLGVKPAVINNYTRGKQQSKPGFEVLYKIASEYPDVNVDWLLTGRGEMLISQGKGGARERWVISTQDITGNITVPLINRRAAANYLTGHQSQEYFEQLDAIQLPSSFLSGKQYYALQVSGDSMMPTLHDGDYVFCYRCDRSEWSNLNNGDVCVILSENGLQIKRLANKDNQSHITCVSDNFQTHPAFNLTHDEIVEMWKVTWRMSSWLSNDEVGGSIYNKINELESRLQRIERVQA